jgi:hypothetical protein
MPPLSKSKIIAFRQCPKRLWLEVNRPNLREDSVQTKAVFQVGHEVGAIARRIYDPGQTGVEIEVAAGKYAEAFARSKELLAAHDRPVFEAGFKTGGALAFADVMLPKPTSSAWKMVEVKSSTSVKDYHRDDVAVQTHIARTSGIEIESIAVATIDSSWGYPGNNDYRGLLAETDLTQEALARDNEVKGWIAEAQRIAAQKNEPDISPGDQCSTPFECGFCAYCTSKLKQPECPLGWLPRFSANKKAEMIRRGVDDLRQVPDQLLNDTQLRVKKHTAEGTVYFDAAGAATDLAPYGFPAYFLDFETINFAVPIWAGTRPYQQVPFQFSLHVVDANRDLDHRSFLDLSGQDPSEPFARTLIADCGTHGPIFVYNAAFESTRIRELAERFPLLATKLNALIPRIVDLLPIARNRYYHPSQQGSWSIKAVLPAIAPELRYDGLEGVQDGGMAMGAFAEAIRPDTAPERRTEIERQLQTYCGLDTLAMVRLWEFFRGNQPAPSP